MAQVKVVSEVFCRGGGEVLWGWGWHRCCCVSEESWHQLRNRCLVFTWGDTGYDTGVVDFFFFLRFP